MRLWPMTHFSVCVTSACPVNLPYRLPRASSVVEMSAIGLLLQQCVNGLHQPGLGHGVVQRVVFDPLLLGLGHRGLHEGVDEEIAAAARAAVQVLVVEVLLLLGQVDRAPEPR